MKIKSFAMLLMFLILSKVSIASIVDLGHPSLSPSSTVNVGEADRNIVFDALTSFTIASAGILFDPLEGGATEIGIEIWDMSLTAGVVGSRNALLASNATVISDMGMTFYDVALNFTFNAGTRYNIAFNSLAASNWGIGPNSMEFYNFNFPDAPYNVAGLLSVLDGGFETQFTNSVMPHIRLDTTFSAVPVPATVALFGTGLIGLIGMRKKSLNVAA